MIERRQELDTIEKMLKRNPVVGIVGDRQVGKTTLAQRFSDQSGSAVIYYDLENPEDETCLADLMLVLKQHNGLVVFDEIQRHPDIFPVLRILADRKRTPARFLILGSASPELMQKNRRRSRDVWPITIQDETFPMKEKIRAVVMRNILKDLSPLV